MLLMLECGVVGGVVVLRSQLIEVTRILVMVQIVLMIVIVIVGRLSQSFLSLGVHSEDKISVFDVGLAGHEKRGVVFEAPVVRRVPLGGVPRVEVISPPHVEITRVQIVVIHFDPVVFGEQGFVTSDLTFAPRLPRGGPEVHHNLRGELQKVYSVSVDSFADQVVIHVPGHIIGGPFEGVFLVLVLGVKRGHIVMILGPILPDNVQREGVLFDRRHNLKVKLIPPVRPVFNRVGEE